MKDLSDFEALIHRCEALAERSPGTYRMRVALLAVLGIAFVLVMLFGALALGLGVAAAAILSKHIVLIKFAIIPLALCAALLRALWMHIPAPDGHEVTRKTAPKLFAEIKDVHDQLKTLKVHRVVIAPESFNAAVVQIPRLGPFGWPRNHLIIGLPLLEALPRDQFRAVLGHEFGHLSRTQSRFRNWIYRSRQTWQNLSGEGGVLIGPFMRWYAPYFSAYSFVLARTNEYDADRAAAHISSAPVMAAALSAVSVKGHYLEDGFWTALMKRAAFDPTPPPAPFRDYLALARNLPDAMVESGLRRALAQKTSLSDTHPCLADRLKALDVSAVPPQFLKTSAAQELLGPVRDQLIDEVNAAWAGRLAPRWAEAHERGTATAAKLEEYAAKSQTLDSQGMFEYATLLEEAHHGEHVLPWLEASLARAPQYAPALFMHGRLRLEAGDEGGTQEIEEAMHLDPDALEGGSRILFSYFNGQRNIARAKPYLATLQRLEAQRMAAHLERTQTLDEDSYLPHGLAPEQAQLFADACAGDPGLKRAWLVRKDLKLTAERPLYVVIVAYRWLHKPTQDQLQALVTAMPDVDIRLFVQDTRKPVARKVAAVSGSLIYQRV